jgi:hypothetical protein
MTVPPSERAVPAPAVVRPDFRPPAVLQLPEGQKAVAALPPGEPIPEPDWDDLAGAVGMNQLNLGC